MNTYVFICNTWRDCQGQMRLCEMLTEVCDSSAFIVWAQKSAAMLKE